MNLPLSAWHYEIVIYASEHKAGLTQNFKVIVVYPAYSREEYTNRMSYEGTWTGWVKTATATPPQEYALPLAAGVSVHNYCGYTRTQTGLVSAYGAVDVTSFSAGKSVGTLPEGYRPRQIVEVPASISSSVGRVAGTISATPDGNIAIISDVTGSIFCCFCVVFPSS